MRGSGHRPHLSLEGQVRTESRRQPRSSPMNPRCDAQVFQGLLQAGWTVRVGLDVPVFSGLDPLCSAARVPG